MIPEYFIIIGSLLSFYGALSYLVDTIKGKAKPNRVTFFLWGIAPLIAFAAEVKQGVGLPSLMTFIVGFNPLMIFIASFINKKSEWKISQFDIVCGIISVLGTLGWYITKVGNVAIAFSIFADLLAGIPTVVKSYKAPQTESYKVYLFGGVNSVITLLALKTWNFTHYAFPIYILLINIVLVSLVRFKFGKKLSRRFS